MATATEYAEPRLKTDKLMAIIANNTALYVLAYLITHTIVQLSEILVAYQYRIHTIWNPSKINFLIPDPDWRRSAVILTYGVGQTLCAILAGLAYLRLIKAAERRGLMKAFWAWLVLHGCNQFFGAMAADNFVREGFWYSPRWLFWTSNVPSVGLGFLFANICLLIGYKMSIPFLKTCDSISLMQLPNRMRLIGTLIFAPWLFGTLVIEITKFPVMTLLEQTHQLSILLLLIPLAVGCRYQMYEMTVERPRATRVAWGIVLLAIVSCVAFRAILHRGIRFDPKGWPEHRADLF